MEVSVKKTKCMTLQLPGTKKIQCGKIACGNGKYLDEVESEKILGVMIDSRLTYAAEAWYGYLSATHSTHQLQIYAT